MLPERWNPIGPTNGVDRTSGPDSGHRYRSLRYCTPLPRPSPIIAHRIAEVIRCAVAWALAPLLVAFPAVGVEKPLAPQREVIMQPVHPTDPVPGNANYKPPELKDGVVELLDEGIELLFPQLINDGGGEPGTATREDRDVFAGVEAVRVTPMQKYRTRIPGWNFRVVENPQTPAGPQGADRGPLPAIRLEEDRADRESWSSSTTSEVVGDARIFAGQNAVGWTAHVGLPENCRSSGKS